MQGMYYWIKADFRGLGYDLKGNAIFSDTLENWI